MPNPIVFHRLVGIGEGLSGLDRTVFNAKWTVHQAIPNAPVYNASVPGNVQLDLINAGAIPDPFQGKNNDACKWVSDVAWEYENQLLVDSWEKKIDKAHQNGGILHTIFDAIDYDALFYCQNQFIARQTGMFSPTDIACGITPGQSIEKRAIPIKVHFRIQPWWRTHAVKSQMAFGWDFAPEIRTIGIWKNIHQYHTGHAFFSKVYAIAEPLSDNFTQNSIPCEIQLKITLQIIDLGTMQECKEPRTFDLGVKTVGIDKSIPVTGKSGESIQVSIPHAEIPFWFPWSLGEPAIVPISLQLSDQGDLLDQYNGQVINRHIRWLRNPSTFPGDRNWTLEINNRKMFLRGINWVPPDSLYGRIDASRYKRLIDAAHDMGVDMLRVWGGGIEEKPEFYDYCDKIGILIWQEFPFACTNYPDSPNYLRMVANECRSVVLDTRRHPAVAIYCGGNEFNPFINSHIIKIVTRAVSDLAPDRQCLAASPFLGDDHNWKFWGSRRWLDAYDIEGRNGPFRMLTEFGMQAAPVLETLQNCIVGSKSHEIADITEYLQYHKADMGGYKHYANLCNYKITNTASLIRFTQALQAYALKYAIEVCRMAWPNVSGVFPWQLSDPWPNSSWSVIDYNFRPKLGARMLKQVYSSVLPMVKYLKIEKEQRKRNGQIIVHNATQTPFTGKLEVSVLQKTNRNNDKEEIRKILAQEFQIRVSPTRPMLLGTIRVDNSPGTVVRMLLKDDKNRIVSRNFSFPAMEPPKSKISHYSDLINIRFDGWWRKHLTKLMALDRIRSEKCQWLQMKAEREKKAKK